MYKSSDDDHHNNNSVQSKYIVQRNLLEGK